MFAALVDINQKFECVNVVDELTEISQQALLHKKTYRMV